MFVNGFRKKFCFFCEPLSESAVWWILQENQWFACHRLAFRYRKSFKVSLRLCGKSFLHTFGLLPRTSDRWGASAYKERQPPGSQLSFKSVLGFGMRKSTVFFYANCRNRAGNFIFEEPDAHREWCESPLRQPWALHRYRSECRCSFCRQKRCPSDR